MKRQKDELCELCDPCDPCDSCDPCDPCEECWATKFPLLLPLLGGVITRFSKGTAAAPLLIEGAFWPGKSDLERTFPPTVVPTSAEIEKANGNKNFGFFTATEGYWFLSTKYRTSIKIVTRAVHR
jgi:hypothetical protein